MSAESRLARSLDSSEHPDHAPHGGRPAHREIDWRIAYHGRSIRQDSNDGAEVAHAVRCRLYEEPVVGAYERRDPLGDPDRREGSLGGFAVVARGDRDRDAAFLKGSAELREVRQRMSELDGIRRAPRRGHHCFHCRLSQAQ